MGSVLRRGSVVQHQQVQMYESHIILKAARYSVKRTQCNSLATNDLCKNIPGSRLRATWPNLFVAHYCLLESKAFGRRPFIDNIMYVGPRVDSRLEYSNNLTAVNS